MIFSKHSSNWENFFLILLIVQGSSLYSQNRVLLSFWPILGILCLVVPPLYMQGRTQRIIWAFASSVGTYIVGVVLLKGDLLLPIFYFIYNFGFQLLYAGFLSLREKKFFRWVV